MGIKIDDWLTHNNGIVFQVASFSERTATIPPGWPMTKEGQVINPRFVQHYKGATSVLVDV